MLSHFALRALVLLLALSRCVAAADCVNGGVPQRANLTLQLLLFDVITDNFLPDKDYSGSVNLDFEVSAMNTHTCAAAAAAAAAAAVVAAEDFIFCSAHTKIYRAAA